MNSPRPYRRAAALLLAALLLAFALPARSAPLRIAYPEYRPYFALGEDGTMGGFFYEIIQEALAGRMDIDVAWECFPWPRCQSNVQSGRQDAMITVPTRERAAYTSTHAKPFYIKPLEIFTYSSNPRLHDILALRTLHDIKAQGFSVITYSGNGWNKQLVESMGIPVLETPTLKSVWQMLAGKRGDLAIEWPRSAWPDIHKVHAQHDVVQTGVVISSMPFHLLIRKGSEHENLLKHFDTVIRTMHQDGTMRAILNKYGIDR